ncbi:hypothetical protein LZL87_002255 [Fusarium oxysporum]|nr:hypothetical protein LZL87_002255 [Fusarium oxysporum]
MCFVFTNPDLIIDEPELQSANLNMDKKGDTLSENEASPTRQRYEPRDIKDLTGHTFGTMPPYFKPVLTIPWTERPDQGISNFPADLTIIERFTTVTQSEQSITTSIPRRLTPGTEIEIVTIIDGTKFILQSSTSDATTTSQESEITSPKETTTDVPSLSTEKTLLTSSPNKSGEESSWTTSYTTASSTELRPSSSPANPSGAPIRSDTAAIVAGASSKTPPAVFDLFSNLHEHLPNSPIVQVKGLACFPYTIGNIKIYYIMKNQETSASHGTDLSSKNHHNDRRELVDLTGSVYSTIPSGFKPVLTFASEDLPGNDREGVTVIDKVDGTSTKNGVVVISTETWEPFTWYTRHKHDTFTLVLRPTETRSNDTDILSLISQLTLPDATPTTSSEELTSSSSTSESLAIPTAKPSNGSLSAAGWAFVLVTAVFVLVLSIMVTVFIMHRSHSRHNQNNFNIQLDNAPF